MYVLDGALGTGDRFYLISADRLIHWAFLKYTTGGTELTLFSVKFIQRLRVCVCEAKTVYMYTLVMCVKPA